MRRSQNKREIQNLGPLGALMVGICEMAAIIPGISRSGATILGGLMGKLKGEDAVEFALVLSIPASLGAALLAARDVMAMSETISIIPMLIGFVTSLTAGYLAIRLLNAALKKTAYSTPRSTAFSLALS